MSIAAITGIALLIFSSYYFTSGKSKLNVNSERITISTVKNGTFKEFIPVNGIVLPQTTIYLDAVEGGRVEEKFVEDGVMMKKGDPILRLANTDLELSLSNQETAVFNLLTQMQISRNAAQQNKIMKLNQKTDVESSFKEAERIYNLNKKLYEQQAISLQEYKQSENNYNYCFITLYIFSCLAIIRLRKSEPDMPRPFRTPFYPVVPIIALTIASVALVAMSYFNIKLAIIYFAVITFAFVLYKLFNSSDKS